MSMNSDILLSLTVFIAALIGAAFVLIRTCTQHSAHVTSHGIELLHKKLDAVLTHLDIAFSQHDNVPAIINDALANNQRIDAIKHYRRIYSASLIEATMVIDAIIAHRQRDRPVTDNKAMTINKPR